VPDGSSGRNIHCMFDGCGIGRVAQSNLKQETNMKTIAAAAMYGALALWVSGVSAQPAGPTDPQIAAIVVTANHVDIDAGKLATNKA